MPFFENKLENNIKNIYIFKFLKWFLIVSPITYVFYQENGISPTEIMTLKAIYSLSVSIFELPSGYIADHLGRRKTLIYSSILAFIAFSLYSFSNNFYHFVIVQLFLGLATSLSSGTDSALLYDTLSELKKNKSYKKNERNILSIESFSEATASILGGLLATVNMRYNIYFETFFIFVSIIFSFMIVEPHTKKIAKPSIRDSYNSLKLCSQQNINLKWFVLYSAIISSSTLTFASLIQPYLKFVGVEVAMFGIVWASLRYSVTIFSFFTAKIENYLGEVYSLMSFITIIFISYMLISLVDSKFGVLIFFLIYFARAFNKPILKSNINDLVTSDVRATTLSITSFVTNIIFSALAPLLGYVTGKISISAAFYLAGIIHVVLGLIPLAFLIKKDTKVSSENKLVET